MLKDTEFYSLLSKAREVMGWFYVESMPLIGTLGPNGGVIIEEYNEVDYEGIEMLKKLENYLKIIFSDEIVKRLLKTGRYFEVDGKLCTVAASRGTNSYYGKIVEVTKNTKMKRKYNILYLLKKGMITLK